LLAALAARGHETLRADLAAGPALGGPLQAALGGRPVAGVVLADVLEHLVDPLGLLHLAHALCEPSGAALVVSVPNVTHRDLAAKLLAGRFDQTPTGLLDETHLRFLDPASLDRLLRAGGFTELERLDLPLERSDQWFPPDLAHLAPGAPLADLLRSVAGQRPGATTNQFVRAYRPGSRPDERSARASLLVDRDRVGREGPFLSVVLPVPVVVEEGRWAARPEADPVLAEAALSLAAQEDPDLEVLLLPVPGERPDLWSPGDPGAAPPWPTGSEPAPEAWLPQGLLDRTRWVPTIGPRFVAEGLGPAIRAARGPAVGVLAGAVVQADWVGTFRSLAEAIPGAVLRAGVGVQRGRPVTWPGANGPQPGFEPTEWPQPDAGVVDWLAWALTPDDLVLPAGSGFALPLRCGLDLEAMAEGLPDAEPLSALALRLAAWCGLAQAPAFTSLRRLPVPGAPPTVRGVQVVRDWLVRQWVPLGPPQLTELLRALDQARQAAQGAAAEAARLRQELAALQASRSWQVTAPLRRATGLLRRLRALGAQR
ncbi:methyltransferase domain-containing protein, partial [Aciditerrimonas ferrireducens]